MEKVDYMTAMTEEEVFGRTGPGVLEKKSGRSSVNNLDILSADSAFINLVHEEPWNICSSFLEEELFVSNAILETSHFSIDEVSLCTPSEAWLDCFENPMVNLAEGDSLILEYPMNHGEQNLEELEVHLQIAERLFRNIHLIDREPECFPCEIFPLELAIRSKISKVDLAIAERFKHEQLLNLQNRHLQFQLMMIYGIFPYSRFETIEYSIDPVILEILAKANCAEKKTTQVLYPADYSNFAGLYSNSSRPENVMDAALRVNDDFERITEISFSAKDDFKKISQWWHRRSYRENTYPMKLKNESQRNVSHLLLLIASLLATITFHTALKTSGYGSEEGYKYDSSQNVISKIDPLSYPNWFFITFNSAAFFLSIALLMRLFNELPLRPLLHISAFSMLGAYMCTIWDPLKPRSYSS